MQIGLIAEGASELRILKHILGRYVGTEHALNEIQPKTNADGTQADGGGWHRVITTFENENTIQEALIENDYVLIQIDTDHAQTAPYSVSTLGDNGQTCSDEALFQRVQERILNNIPKISKEKRQRIILAICINEIECWLLPIYYNDNQKCKTSNCVRLLNTALNRKKLHPITDKNSATARRSYDAILKEIKKPKDIKDCAQYNFGFKSFVEQLDGIKEEISK